METQLPPDDLDALLGMWPTALACATWRLDGGCPSPVLVDEIRSEVARETLLREAAGQVVGVLQVREVDRITGSAFFSFAVQRHDTRPTAAVLPFLTESFTELDLRRITTLVDEDMLAAVANARSHLVQVGVLHEYTMAERGRYVDRYVFDFTGQVDRP